jgi:hypothetical protein
VTVRFCISQTISFAASGTDYTLLVPDATITFSPAVTTATTSFDAGTTAGSPPCHRRG